MAVTELETHCMFRTTENNCLRSAVISTLCSMIKIESIFCNNCSIHSLTVVPKPTHNNLIWLFSGNSAISVLLSNSKGGQLIWAVCWWQYTLTLLLSLECPFPQVNRHWGWYYKYDLVHLLLTARWVIYKCSNFGFVWLKYSTGFIIICNIY